MSIARRWLPVLALVAVAGSAHGQWTQFGGPTRDFHAPAGELAPTWPEGGPPVTWRRPLGDGYSGVLVDGDRLYTLYRADGNEVVVCMERATGATVWEHAYPVVTTSSAQQFGDGPSATPTIAGDRLVTVGIGIDVHCLDKETGDVLWGHDLMEEFEIPMPGRGHSSSPLVVGDLVVLQAGGTDLSNAINDAPNLGLEGGSVLAFDLETGEIAWASQNFPESKASPLLIEFQGGEQIVVFMGNELAGLDPRYGDLLWRFPHATDYGFNCTTPVWDGVDTLVCSSSYNNWAEAVELVAADGGIEARKKWSSRRLRIHFTNLLLVDGRLFGVSGSTRPGLLSCLDLESGEMLWRTRDFPRANLVYAGGPFLVFDEDGRLSLVTFTDEGHEVHGEVAVTDSHAFTAPTLVGSDLYVRDRRYLTAFDLSPAAVAGARDRGLDVLGPELPEDVEALLGRFQTDDPGGEPDGVAVVIADGWLALELGEASTVRLALQEGRGRWEFVEDRTSGSTPRTLEFQRGADGAVEGFLLRSPAQEPRTYRRASRD
jgi:outer membrane protein assembly factor BamB